jgi:hypothetical protein
VAFISGEPQLDADGLRRLSAACLDTADELDQLATDAAGSTAPISAGTDELDAEHTGRRLTIAVIEHMKRLGYSQSDIAREYGVTRQAVSWHVRRYGSLTPVQQVFEHFPFQVPPEPSVSNQGGWRYLPRQAADGELLIRVNEHTMLTDEGRRIWRLPPA